MISLKIVIPALAVIVVLQGLFEVKSTVDRIVAPPIQGTVLGQPIDVRRGEVVMLNWEILKRVDCPGFSGRAWSGADGFLLVEQLTPTSIPQADEPRIYHIPTLIPPQAPNGELELTVKGYYECPNSDREHFDLGPVALNVTP